MDWRHIEVDLVDALKAQGVKVYRYVGLFSSGPSGDWVFEIDDRIINITNLAKNLSMVNVR
jgi:hypothetical protein